ncbi:HNH endonuclease [Cellulomonas sp. NPDC089187]|uniref:HNH endonuclease n=1 Tax=Cellulomonas sp. NPDC089187 TaxID=3154970 RepID=UPI00343C4F46
MSSAGDWGGRKVSEARRYWTRRLGAGPLPCYRCRRPVHLGQRWQVEHITPRSLGGRLGRDNEWVSHGRCNESHGGKLGAARTNARNKKATVRLESERERGIRGW